MRRLNHTAEYRNLVDLLRLQPGRSVVDARARADEMPSLVREQIGPRGTLVCCAFADRPLKELSEIDGVNPLMAYPNSLPLPNQRFHGALLHNTDGMTGLARPLSELARVTLPGARVLVSFTDWDVRSSELNDAQQVMVQALKLGPLQSGEQFIEQMSSARRGYSSWAFDAYLLGIKGQDGAPRYDYDWRSLMREQLRRRQQFTPTQIVRMVDELTADKQATVSVSRYLALGTRSR